VRIDAAGRVELPATFRRALGVEAGDQLIGALVDGEVRLTTVAESVRRAQVLVRQTISAGLCLSDELIAERRAEPERE
jgi:bifunctional DNA-binding transcriptional regulator/antitoxin component of YhaV-PrlF toxin-antitoxin module